MTNYKVAILGIGKIGEFHAREFNNYGCQVAAILTSSEKTAKEKAEKLRVTYGINARPYWELEKLIEGEDLDMVSICTPSELHSRQVKRCLEAGLHVLCEKPFTLDSSVAKELLDLADKSGKTLMVNTQWTIMLDTIPKNYLEGIKKFSMYMEPGIRGEINLAMEALPHMNSFLIKLMDKEQIRDLVFTSLESDRIVIEFKYGNCDVEYSIGFKEERPRKIKFKIGDTEFERKIVDEYKQSIVYNKGEIALDDPLKVFIRAFIDSAINNSPQLIGKAEILHNSKLQDRIINEIIKKSI
jgi:Oxidoreductase family, NAD-binding Rossmann fold